MVTLDRQVRRPFAGGSPAATSIKSNNNIKIKIKIKIEIHIPIGVNGLCTS